jgi:4-phytase/acid phosphatase
VVRWSRGAVRTLMAVGLVAAAAIVCAARVARAAAEPLTLQYVAIISRHGVRSPNWEPKRLDEFSAEPWPDFGVPPGHLTPHGREMLLQMGAYYRDWLASDGLIRTQGCGDASRLYIWADTDQRTMESGRAFSAALMPGCGVPVHSWTSRGADPLFDPIDAGVVKPDRRLAVEAVKQRLGPDPQAYVQSRAAAFATLDRILTGSGRARQMPFRSSIRLNVVPAERGADISGPLATASTLTEDLLLEYANGFPPEQLGWGRLTPQNLEEVLELHTAYADMARRTPYLAQARGSNLLTHILRSMEQAVTRTAVPGALGEPGDAVVIVAGHDTNLSNLSGMLNLTWKVPGYPRDDVAPGGALVFSLWRDEAAGRAVVKLRYVSQTAEQLHRGDSLSLATPPAVEDLAVPGCGTARECPWEDFFRAASQSLAPADTR